MKKEVVLKKQSAQYNLEAMENELRNSWVRSDYEIEAAELELQLYKQEIEKTQILLRVLTSEYSNNSTNF